MSHKGKDPPLMYRKVALLGFRSVGKSSIVNSFITGTFSDTYVPTIETTYNKTIRFRKVHFATDIVDTAGMVGVKAMQQRPPVVERSSCLTNTARCGSFGVWGGLIVVVLVAVCGSLVITLPDIPTHRMSILDCRGMPH